MAHIRKPKIRVLPFSIASLSLSLSEIQIQSVVSNPNWTTNSKLPSIRICLNSNRHYLVLILLYSNLRNVKSFGSINYVCRSEFEKESNYGMQVWRRNSCSNCYRYLQSKLWKKVLELQKLQKSIWQGCCSFFKLVDEEFCDEKDLKIAKLEKKNTKLKNELGKTRSWLKISIILGLLCFGVCLVLGTIQLCKPSGNLSNVYLK